MLKYTPFFSHEVYREAISEHLMRVSLRHWDASMRRLAAQALARVSNINADKLVPLFAERSTKLLSSADATDVHGGLLALSELYKQAGYKGGEIGECREKIG